MSVRIVRGASTGRPPPATLAPNAAFVATARRIHASEYQARIEGERIVAAAQREAEAIVGRAHVEAEAIAERARVAGADAGKLEALSIIAAARAHEASAIDRSLDVVVLATRAVAERALGHAISTDDAALVGWAREALAPLRGARKIAVRGTASSLERLRSRLAEVRPVGCDVVELVVDAGLPEGVLLARSELGEVRVEVTTQVAAFAEVLRQTLAPIVRGPRE